MYDVFHSDTASHGVYQDEGMLGYVARSTLTRYVVGSSPTRTEHFGFPPSAP